MPMSGDRNNIDLCSALDNIFEVCSVLSLLIVLVPNIAFRLSNVLGMN